MLRFGEKKTRHLGALLGLLLLLPVLTLGLGQQVASAQSTLGVELYENPFVCNGELRTMGSVFGLQANETIEFSSPQMGGVFSRRVADSNGRVSIRWRCSWPTQWSVTVRATSTGTSTAFSVLGVTSSPKPAAILEPTAVPTPIPTATAEPTAVPTATSEPTATPEPTATVEPTVEPTATPVPTATAAPIAIVEPTPAPATTVEPTTTGDPVADSNDVDREEMSKMLATVAGDGPEPPEILASVQPQAPATADSAWFTYAGGALAVFTSAIALAAYRHHKRRDVVEYRNPAEAWATS